MTPEWITIITIVAGVIAAVASVVAAITAVIVVFRNKHKDDLQLAEWKGSVQKDLSAINKFMARVDEKFENINQTFFKVFARLSGNVASDNSPRQLNDLGKEIAKLINADTWSKQLSYVVYPKLTSKESYDIQEFSLMYVWNDNNYTDQERQLLRRVAFEKGISENEVQEVLGLELRDKLLEMINE
ncbi:MAG: hypothetical protein OXL40_06685 [Bacteroidota bacterium]|nr:hypothetical protein [Bacteroidota bacterium]